MIYAITFFIGGEQKDMVDEKDAEQVDGVEEVIDGRFHYVYKITNNINGKIYVGAHSTQDLEDGYFGSSEILDRAIAKHGRENFTIEVLEYFGSKEEAYLKESEIVTPEFAKRSDTYNVKAGGKGGWGVGKYAGRFGKKASIETREKQSIAKKGKYAGDKSYSWGKKASDETREKQSIAHSGERHYYYGKHLTDEHKQNLSKHFKGIPLSEEHCKKLSIAHKGKCLSEEGKRNLSNALKKHWENNRGKYDGEKHPRYGKHMSAESRAKISYANKGCIVPEGRRDRIAKTLTGRKDSEETRKKKSEAQKRRQCKLREEKNNAL